MIRVSGYDQFQLTQYYLNNVQYDTEKTQEQISTGKILNRPSDDPVRMNSDMLINATQSKFDQYQKSVGDAQSILQFIDTMYGETESSLQEAQQTAVQGANGTMTASDRSAMADSIQQNINEIVGYANTQTLGRYVFSGEKVDTQPLTYDQTTDTLTYNGNDNNMTIQVSNQMNATVSQSADQVFVPVINTLIQLKDALKSNDQSGIETAMQNLTTQTNNFTDNRSRIGVQLQSLNLLNDAYSQSQTDLATKKTNVEDVDMASAVSNYTYMQQIYQATIKASTGMLQNSILQYI